MDWEVPLREPFENGFKDLQKDFHNSELKKVVLYTVTRRNHPICLTEKKEALVGALNYAKNSPVYLYGHWDKEEGIIGATPEVLFRLREEDNSAILHTMALAGLKNPIYLGKYAAR